MLIEVRSSPPIVTAAQLPTAQKLGCFSAGYLKVRLAVSGASVSVRPYYERDGRWWPLRADAAAGVGIEPLTADPTIRGGLSEALYACTGVSSFVVLVAESGLASNVVAAYMEIVEQ